MFVEVVALRYRLQSTTTPTNIEFFDYFSLYMRPDRISCPHNVCSLVYLPEFSHSLPAREGGLHFNQRMLKMTGYMVMNYAIIFMLTGSIVALNFFTDVLLAIIDPRVRHSVMG